MFSLQLNWWDCGTIQLLCLSLGSVVLCCVGLKAWLKLQKDMLSSWSEFLGMQWEFSALVCACAFSLLLKKKEGWKMLVCLERNHVRHVEYEGFHWAWLYTHMVDLVFNKKKERKKSLLLSFLFLSSCSLRTFCLFLSFPLLLPDSLSSVICFFPPLLLPHSPSLSSSSLVFFSPISLPFH